MLAKSPRSLRSRSSPASGRTSYGTLSHFGPPTAPKITASAACALAIVLLVTETLVGLERAHAMPVHPGDQLFHLGHDLGADAVAGEEQELVGRHLGSPCC